MERMRRRQEQECLTRLRQSIRDEAEKSLCSSKNASSLFFNAIMEFIFENHRLLSELNGHNSEEKKAALLKFQLLFFATLFPPIELQDPISNRSKAFKCVSELIFEGGLLNSFVDLTSKSEHFSQLKHLFCLGASPFSFCNELVLLSNSQLPSSVSDEIRSALVHHQKSLVSRFYGLSEEEAHLSTMAAAQLTLQQKMTVVPETGVGEESAREASEFVFERTKWYTAFVLISALVFHVLLIEQSTSVTNVFEESIPHDIASFFVQYVAESHRIWSQAFDLVEFTSEQNTADIATGTYGPSNLCAHFISQPLRHLDRGPNWVNRNMTGGIAVRKACDTASVEKLVVNDEKVTLNTNSDKLKPLMNSSNSAGTRVLQRDVGDEYRRRMDTVFSAAANEWGRGRGAAAAAQYISRVAAIEYDERCLDEYYENEEEEFNRQWQAWEATMKQHYLAQPPDSRQWVEIPAELHNGRRYLNRYTGKIQSEHPNTLIVVATRNRQWLKASRCRAERLSAADAESERLMDICRQELPGLEACLLKPLHFDFHE